ncbi:hypothetical protein LUZ63_002368 [Rhynchospora breviuscula]|uniref:Uncharacterized protein n=1 Tax=Rhynchospora breviuscula TaxID=2022672 RepID=A0A9Q0CZZ0_9POAL|nr:hypothetical protein LUZ63_002368 [Rhynchospora breviuscula]
MASAHTAASAPNLLSVHRHIRFSRISTSSNRLTNALFSNSTLFPSIYTQSTSINPFQKRFSWQPNASSSGEGISARSFAEDLPFDGFLSAAEFLCIVPPALYSIACFVSLFVPSVAKLLRLSTSSKLFVTQYLFLIGAVVIGNLIRWRQWQRLCFVNYRGTSVDLISRIERVEDDLKSSSRIVSVLSRQLEKLGIRFRVTKKAFKDPISEMAALAQKNSEATRALAMQKELLEKELHEIQHVLLAMQEQQQKQLHLILAIGQAQRTIDEKQGPPAEEIKSSGRTSVTSELETKEQEIQSEAVTGSSNDKA